MLYTLYFILYTLYFILYALCFMLMLYAVCFIPHTFYFILYRLLSTFYFIRFAPSISGIKYKEAPQDQQLSLYAIALHVVFYTEDTLYTLCSCALSEAPLDQTELYTLYSRRILYLILDTLYLCALSEAPQDQKVLYTLYVIRYTLYFILYTLYVTAVGLEVLLYTLYHL